MIQLRALYRIDFRVVVIMLCLMFFSVATIASYSAVEGDLGYERTFFTPMAMSQIKWCIIGFFLFFLFAAIDYNKLREFAWILYAISIIALIGLFFTDAIARVHRWYRLPFVGFNFQPSELTKLALILAMSWYLERRQSSSFDCTTAFGASAIFGVPFILILKQPDLGSALVLYPLALVMGYFGGLRSLFIRMGVAFGIVAVTIVFIIFSGIASYDEVKPYMRPFLKEYQFERLNPDTHHGKAATLAIGVGGAYGVGWGNSEYAKAGSLPAPYTDSVFAAFGEEFGVVGLIFVLVLFYYLLYCCTQVAILAHDPFGRLVAAGITTYMAVHVVINVGMMCGMLPITGVPLVLMSYGGSSLAMTMTAMGIIQSIYSRRFVFA